MIWLPPYSRLAQTPLFLGHFSSLLWHNSPQSQLNNFPCLPGLSRGLHLTNVLAGPWFQLSRGNRLYPVQLGAVSALPCQLIWGQVRVQPPPLGVYGPVQDVPLPLRSYWRRTLWMNPGGGVALAWTRWCRHTPPNILPPYLSRVPCVTMWRIRLTQRLPLTQLWPGRPPQEWRRHVTPMWDGGIPTPLPLRQASVTHPHPLLGRSMPRIGYSAT